LTASTGQGFDGRRYVEFDVAGTPVPQGSKSIGRTRTGQSFVHESNRARLEPWRHAITAAAQHAMGAGSPLTGPLVLTVVFRFGRPKAHYRGGRHADELRLTAPHLHDKRPDLDKLLRALGDALTGTVFTDDAQVAEVAATKAYGPPGVHVVVAELRR